MIRLGYEGLKVLDRKIDLQLLNLVTGPNGSGKTTIFQAIKIAALSYDPEIGKRPMDTSALMRGAHLGVSMTLDDDRSFRRSIDATPSGGFKGSATASWLGTDAKDTEHKDAIQNLFGMSAEEIAQSLDITQLLKASPNARATILEDLLQAQGEDPTQVAHRVMRFALLRLTETSEGSTAKNKDMFPMVALAQRPILTAASPILLGKVTKSGLGEASEWAKIEKLASDHNLKSKSAAESELRTALLKIPETHPEELARLETDRDELTRVLGALEDRRDRQTLQMKLQHDTAADHELWTEKMVSAQAKLKAEGLVGNDPQPPAPADYGLVTDLRKEAVAIRERAKGIDLVEIPDISSEKERFTKAKRNRDSMSSSLWGEVITFADELNEGIEDSRDWAGEIRSIGIKGLGFNPTDMESEYEEAKRMFVEATTFKGQAEKLRAQRTVDRSSLQDEAEEKDEEASDAATQIDKDFRIARSEYRRLEGVREQFDTASGRVRELRAKLDGIGTIVVADELDDSISEKGDELSRTKAAMLALQDAVATRASLQRIVTELKTALAVKEVYAAIEYGLKRARQAAVTDAGHGLTDVMQKFLGTGAGIDHVPYVRADKHKCDVGWREVNGREVAIQAMSGGEWALFAAALTAAVVSLRKAELKFLLIEAGEADYEMLERILCGIEAIRDTITCAIVLFPRLPKDDHGWNVIQFSIPEIVTQEISLENTIKRVGEGA